MCPIEQRVVATEKLLLSIEMSLSKGNGSNSTGFSDRTRSSAGVFLFMPTTLVEQSMLCLLWGGILLYKKELVLRPQHDPIQPC